MTNYNIERILTKHERKEAEKHRQHFWGLFLGLCGGFVVGYLVINIIY